MNLLELKRSAMGYHFRCGGGDDGGNPNANADVRENANANASGNVDNRENPTSPASQEDAYIQNLRNSMQAFAKNNADENGNVAAMQTMQAKYTPEEAIDMYNRKDGNLVNDPVMTANILRGKDYWKEEGSFAPGEAMTTAENLKAGMKQWHDDDERAGQRDWKVALAALAAFTGGAALYAAPAAGAAGAGAAVAGEVGAAAGTGAAVGEGVAAGGAVSTAIPAAEVTTTSLGSLGAGEAAGGGGLMSSANQFLSTPVGKFAASQGVGALTSAMKSDGGNQSNPGLINSTQSRPERQPSTVNYYSQPAAPSIPKTTASANGTMYGSGSGWGASIAKYMNTKTTQGA